MDLPVMPPLRPMLARLVSEIPEHLIYEPKFDGFRCIVFRDGKEVELGSRNERPLTRYFPELVAAAKDQLPQRCVLDAEIVVRTNQGLDFEALQLRLHPAASRVALLSREIPASLIAFDLLALDDTSYLDRPFLERRAMLGRALAHAGPPIFRSPSTSSIEAAREWFSRFEGAGLDGVIAKAPEAPYAPDRRIMFKVKHERTAECVVAGFRWHKSGPVVGSLLLGLYEDAEVLHHVGVAASFALARRSELLEEIAAHRLRPGESHPWVASGSHERIPGGSPSRWNRERDHSWEPLRPELVAEVGYDHLEGAQRAPRFRHVTHFRRWRPDRDPHSCTFEQLERPVAFDLDEVFSTGDSGALSLSVEAREQPS
ncbi:MAG: ATP-dependent DNA ligase [Actinomycetota bacterium]